MCSVTHMHIHGKNTKTFLLTNTIPSIKSASNTILYLASLVFAKTLTVSGVKFFVKNYLIQNTFIISKLSFLSLKVYPNFWFLFSYLCLTVCTEIQNREGKKPEELCINQTFSLLSSVCLCLALHNTFNNTLHNKDINTRLNCFWQHKSTGLSKNFGYKGNTAVVGQTYMLTYSTCHAVHNCIFK